MPDFISLVVTRANPVNVYPPYGVLRSFTIDASVLINDLLHPTRLATAYVSLATLTTLYISLKMLDRLVIEDFSLQNPNFPPRTIAYLARLPLPVPELSTTRTHGQSLSFLLDCIQCRELILGGCWFMDNLPPCSSLTLRRIGSFDGFMEMLSEWNGTELIIKSSGFLDKRAIRDWLRQMRDAEESLWPRADISFRGYPYAMRRRIHELLDIRSQL